MSLTTLGFKKISYTYQIMMALGTIRETIEGMVALFVKIQLIMLS